MSRVRGAAVAVKEKNRRTVPVSPMTPLRTAEDEEALTVEVVNAISRDIAAKYDRRLEVMGVAPTDGKGDVPSCSSPSGVVTTSRAS